MEEAPTTIYTIGYIGIKPDQFVRFLELNPRMILVDVRYSANSRVPAWRKGALEARHEGKYFHCKALGNANYKGNTIQLHKPQEGVEQMRAIISTNYTPVLMCACEDHVTCHRSSAAALLVQELGVKVIHLDKSIGLPPAKPKPTQLTLF